LATGYWVRRTNWTNAGSGNRLDAALANDDLGTMISWSGKYSEGAGLLEQSLAVYQELGYRPKEIWAQGMLGLQYLLQGNYPSAQAHARSCLELARSVEAMREMALAHYISGAAELGERNYQAAFDQLQEASACTARLIKG
jgi:tetratricopeptide (TPR) repeat protein